ncbi:Coenzyme F420 hydrogenase/dehydrogenase, beta subunit C-terminal domain [Rhodococcoides navarretei]|uniref:Coenzyme F420 hydrogenase/dehydrogenase, beta subunit C-terminal domain n=1 Tax=Rhodococcus navarretei TaxID=3128981 RepID=A0ABU9D2Y4_9NOCA
MLPDSDRQAGDLAAPTPRATVALGFPSIRMVVENDVCVGCGVCSVATGGDIDVTMNEKGYYSAQLNSLPESTVAVGSSVCPFADETPDETAVADRLFTSTPSEDPVVGRYISIQVGRVTSDQRLLGSSSGGMTSWLAGELLDKGLVDGVIHVGSATEPLFEYMTSGDTEGLESNRKSMYYSTTVTEVVNRIRGDGLRYAFVGVPCFVTAMRHLGASDEVLASQVKYFIGLVCGHLKSSFFAQSLAWQTGVAPDRIDSVDFRVKREGRQSSDYDFSAIDSSTGTEFSRPTNSLIGGNWGHGLFQLNACNFCDDIFGETADITFGDAWLPRFKDDWRGTNVVVCRDPQLAELLQDGVSDGRLLLEPLGAEEAAVTQEGNVRHRRVGLSVRLADDAAEGSWTPDKRVVASYEGVDDDRLAIIRSRRKLTERSFEVFPRAVAAGNLGKYIMGMSIHIARHDVLYFRRSLGKIKRGYVVFVRGVWVPSISELRRRSRASTSNGQAD